ncbi:DUF1819 family protein [Metabacillus bambusae]|uniref:DUF1819 family protein n=1 Tax=Metabacillus bambusae TaxID=2795218 RepID=A0ABS3N5E9_9BACI|nr:DUF1819 family protein [Metabacillus bambusae]MBO1513526.1 DUF1819 family protein [Metabacillus bambusae]
MISELQYSSSLTGASFLLYELKQVIGLKVQGLNDKEIKQRVTEENLFQYKYESSIKRSLPSVLRRVNALDETLFQMVLEEPLETGKIINLYAIMKTDRLFFEFMDEVIREKYEFHNLLIETKDLNLYFTVKAEQDNKVAGFTEKTVAKLKQVFYKVLFESGILKDKKTGELSRLLIDEDLKEYIIRIGDGQFVKAMGH